MNGGSSIDAAANWVIAIANGSLAIMLAILAIAAVGFAMLTGRIDMRRAGMVVLGCFLVFGASAIAAQLLGVASWGSTQVATDSAVFQPEMPHTPSQTISPPSSFDPYAGAALPEGR